MLIAQDLAIGPSRNHPLFEGIRFELPKGHFLALLGRNGAGKTTLLRALCGFERPLAGHITLLNKPLEAWSPPLLARHLAVMTTAKAEFPWWTVRQVVALGRQPYTGLSGRLRAEDDAAIDDALARTQLESFSTRRYDYLSDGEKQSVLIARALAQGTPWILLDEPTAHLDFVSRKALFELAERLAREEGKGILVATHEVTLATAHADTLLLLDARLGWHFGTPQELLAQGLLGQLFGV